MFVLTFENSHFRSVGNVALFDLVFMDADKNNYQSYCELILGGDRPMLKEGGVIIIDNVLWKGAVLHQQVGCTPLSIRFPMCCILYIVVYRWETK